jgi:hypothetical protein
MEAQMADNELAAEAAKLAIADLERDLVTASRLYEDSVRDGDTASAAYALRDFNSKQVEYNSLTGANQGQQQSGQLSNAQQNFLSRRAALGDELTPARMDDYARAHTRAIAAGLTPDTPQYFKAIEMAVDTQGDGRQPPLTERTAAELCGVSPEEYAQGAARLRSLKQRGFYQD